MRVKPTGDGPAPVQPVDETAAADPAGAADAVSPVAPVAAVAGALASDPVGEVARRLKAGEITAGDAVDLLIDAVVARHARPGGGALAAEAALADELKALLRREVERDPHLASRVRRLGTRP